MAQMTPSREPQSAAEYDDRTTSAVKSVLIEMGQILGSFQGKFAIIGGAVSATRALPKNHLTNVEPAISRLAWTGSRNPPAAQANLSQTVP